MRSRFPSGTTFIINCDEKPIDGDIILVRFKSNHSASLRELVTDPPRWQLLPITPGSESIYFNENEHLIIGVIILTLIKTRHS
jgi:SOS-response transcriptional repressor LexA